MLCDERCMSNVLGVLSALDGYGSSRGCQNLINIYIYPLFDLGLGGCLSFVFYSFWMPTVYFGSNVFYEPFTTPLTTLINTLVIEVVIVGQIIIRECYDRCIIDLSRKSFMVELYTLEWLNCRNFAKM